MLVLAVKKAAAQTVSLAILLSSHLIISPFVFLRHQMPISTPAPGKQSLDVVSLHLVSSSNEFSNANLLSDNVSMMVIQDKMC